MTHSTRQPIVSSFRINFSFVFEFSKVYFGLKQWFAENPHLEYFEKGISCNVYNMLMWTILNLDPCIKSQQGYGTDQTKSKIKMCAIRVQGSDMTSEKTGRLIHQNHQTKGGVRRVSGRLLYKIPE